MAVVAMASTAIGWRMISPPLFRIRTDCVKLPRARARQQPMAAALVAGGTCALDQGCCLRETTGVRNMVEERTTHTTTPNTAQPNTTTVIERRGGGGTVLIGIALLVAVIVGAFYLMNQSRNETAETTAITGAAESIGEGAQKVGDAAQKAVE
ncbi:MAG TPA: hypothetical protein VL973_03655 [Sphingomonas sp.]|nr:hypothetical protein [Sphingomonas sp.]